MKLRGKRGTCEFIVVNPRTRESWTVDPKLYLASWQAAKMSRRPELIRQFAHYLAQKEAARVGAPVEVHARVEMKLNGGTPGWLVDPEVDLGKEPHRIGASPWITARPHG
jgi:hypothetical protein